MGAAKTRPSKRYAWFAGIGCEGGPMVLGDLTALKAWAGDATPKGAAATTLHYWGQFTSDLPKPWRPNGPVGHQYLTEDTHFDAVARMTALTDMLKKRWPKAKVSIQKKRNETSGDCLLPSGKRLWFELKPFSPYDIASDSLDEDGGGVVAIDAADALVWDVEGAGTVDVGIADDGSVALFRSWTDAPADHAKLREAVLSRPAKGGKKRTLELRVAVLAGVWGPESGGAFKKLKKVMGATAIGPRANPVGFAAPAKVGRWTAVLTSAEGKRGAYRACILRPPSK